MTLTQDPVPVQSELLPRGQLTLTAIARKTGQVVDVLPGSPHPVRRLDSSVTLGTLRPELSESTSFTCHVLENAEYS